jgi:tRNA (cmo5U34)-methyltransferase
MEHAGDAIQVQNARWTFGGDVSEKFDEHVAKSVPLYHEGHTLVTKIADFFLSDGSVCYDLGCSTGALTCLLAKANADKQVKLIAVDREAGMVSKTRERCHTFGNVSVIQADLLDLEFEQADLMVCYYTMQFIKPKNRQIVFNRIFEALHWGGGLLLFEKVRGPDARFQDLVTTLYADYKLDQGFTCEEIVAKTRSLKGVLEPFSTQGNLDLLKRAGFVDIMTVMKYLCFEGFLAIK